MRLVARTPCDILYVNKGFIVIGQSLDLLFPRFPDRVFRVDLFCYSDEMFVPDKNKNKKQCRDTGGATQLGLGNKVGKT